MCVDQSNFNKIAFLSGKLGSEEFSSQQPPDVKTLFSSLHLVNLKEGFTHY